MTSLVGIAGVVDVRSKRGFCGRGGEDGRSSISDEDGPEGDRKGDVECWSKGRSSVINMCSPSSSFFFAFSLPSSRPVLSKPS